MPSPPADPPAGPLPDVPHGLSTLTSIRFRHGESEWLDGSSVSDASGGSSARSRVETVLDMSSGSDSDSGAPPAPFPGGLPTSFRPRNGSDPGSGREPRRSIGDVLSSVLYSVAANGGGGGGERPGHWAAADGNAVEEGSVDLNAVIGDGTQDAAPSARRSSDARRDSDVYNLQQKMNALRWGDSLEDNSTGSSKLWDQLEESIRHANVTREHSPTQTKRRRKRRRKRFLRRCATLFVGVAALVALGGAVGYLVLQDGDKPAALLHAANFLGRILGKGTQEGEPGSRRLPRILADLLARPPSEAELRRREREERIRARKEERVRQRQEIAQARLAQFAKATQRKAMVRSDQGRSLLGIPQERGAAGQNLPPVNEGWHGVPPQEHSQYDGQPHGEEVRRLSLETQYSFHQHNPLGHQDFTANIIPRAGHAGVPQEHTVAGQNVPPIDEGWHGLPPQDYGQ